MKILTVLMYLALAAVAALIMLTVTSNGRIGWDESGPAIGALVVLYVVLALGRRRAASRSTESTGSPPADLHR